MDIIITNPIHDFNFQSYQFQNNKYMRNQFESKIERVQNPESMRGLHVEGAGDFVVGGSDGSFEIESQSGGIRLLGSCVSVPIRQQRCRGFLPTAAAAGTSHEPCLRRLLHIFSHFPSLSLAPVLGAH